MKALKELRDRQIGLYIRKEERGENLSTGYGRLQWLKYELEEHEEHEGRIKIYIDDNNSQFRLYDLLDDINNGYIKAVLVWSIRDVESFYIDTLGLICEEKDIPIVSFCETTKSLNKIIKKLINENREIYDLNSKYFF
ncbi:hypothetical protein [Clostridium sp. FP1]|uniref:hypothetical protein n=1 Tax=Clostridium sp. FP1 TaxID=2724076 RepID=UPI0013E9201F|nr:hypothetical protein [Clostridium sp. FP1]MBZ9633392.1 hypothetical protein [Clostridium sp. FP1]